MDTSADKATPPREGQSQEQPIIIDQPTNETTQNNISRPATEEPTFRFSTEPSNFQFSAGRSFTAPPLDTIDFQPEGPSSQSSTQSRAEKARARTTKAREARARKAAERKASNNTDNTRKTARIAEVAEEANQERLESELSSELDKVNIRDLERQLEAQRTPTNSSGHQSDESDEEFQPSPERSRKRKQPHSEGPSLNIRSARRRRILHSRKPSTSSHQ
jgi:hypothetical protein